MNKKEVSGRIKFYEDTKKEIDSGKFNHVPFYGFNKLQNYIPGVIPGIMYKITSHMGVGKTQLSKYLFVYQTILYALKYNINFNVIYFALEESKERFLDGLFIHILKRAYGIQLKSFSLTGHSKTTLTADELKKIKDAETKVAMVAARIDIIDDKYRPTDIYNTCKYYASKWGTFTNDAEGNPIKYVPRDSRQIVLVVTDHISLLAPEYDKESNTFLSTHRTISKWHTDYCRRSITKLWNWAVLNVQQQSLDSERQQFTSKGSTIINKILPSLDGLGDNKLVGRDDFVVLGIFAPERYGIETYKNYDIKNGTTKSFGDRFRTIHLLKNRLGPPNKILPLYFDGRYNYFKELPPVTDPKINNYYKLLTT